MRISLKHYLITCTCLNEDAGDTYFYRIRVVVVVRQNVLEKHNVSLIKLDRERLKEMQ